MAIIKERCYRIPQKYAKRYTYYSLVSCDSIHHTGEINRLILHNTIKRGKRMNRCKKCYFIEKRGKSNGWSDETKKIFSEKRKGINNPMYGYKPTEEQINKFKERIKKRIFTPEYRKKISDALSGEKNYKWNNNREEVKQNIKIHNACRNLLRRLIKNRKKKWLVETELGYSYLQFKSHIESTWESWMNWNNYSNQLDKFEKCWSIDHIKPVKQFQIEGISDPKIINALSNLRAIEHRKNCIKREKYENK